MSEQGGYSGPQLFERTVALVRRYREILDRSSPAQSRSNAGSDSSPTPQPSQNSYVAEKIHATEERDRGNLKPATPEGDSEPTSQPLIRLPDRNSLSSSPALSSSSHPEQLHSTPLSSSASLSQISPDRKVIFATGGIQNGRQALEVLEAGASVAMLYTALVYGGVSRLRCFFFLSVLFGA